MYSGYGAIDGECSCLHEDFPQGNRILVKHPRCNPGLHAAAENGGVAVQRPRRPQQGPHKTAALARVAVLEGLGGQQHAVRGLPRHGARPALAQLTFGTSDACGQTPNGQPYRGAYDPHWIPGCETRGGNRIARVDDVHRALLYQHARDEGCDLVDVQGSEGKGQLDMAHGQVFPQRKRLRGNQRDALHTQTARWHSEPHLRLLQRSAASA
mmetsp:Transcript_107120/g.341890  ORF Transcript_107120/g.341890 Transcript_107120/m.341890 type:complete len:211 (+) Transcript_107120:270-902(+)